MSILELDRKFLWHPYTQHGKGEHPLPVKSASGAYLELEDGTRLLDAISSWWVNLLGHCHPKIVKAIQTQSQNLDHVLFAGFTHEPAVLLANQLISYAQGKGAELSRAFYSDNGSTAVEVALKMAFQFFRNKGANDKNRFLALRNSYHGDTFGAMAVGDPQGFNPCFRPLLAPVDFIEIDQLDAFEKLLANQSNHYCALIIEPLIQGAGGMKIHSPETLDRIVSLCKKYGIFVIFDEVFTGFYRTGTIFAFEQITSRPDFICLSKGITAGFLPLAVTLTTEAVFESFKSDKLAQAFLHGHSYTANPIACASALATWDELQSPSIHKKVSQIAETTRIQIRSFLSKKNVKNAQSIGTIGAIELNDSNSYFSELAPLIRKEAIKRGVLLRPLGNVIYCVPPLCIQEDELKFIYQVIHEIIEFLADIPLQIIPKIDSLTQFSPTDV